MKKHEAGHVRTAVSLHCMFSCKTHSLAVVGAKSVQLRISRVLTIVSEKKLACVSSAIWGKYFFGLVFNHHWSWTFLPHPCINLSVTSTEPPELYLEKSHSYCMTCVCFVEMQSCPTCFKIFYICFGGVQLLYVHGTHKNIWPSSLPALFRRQHQPTERQDHQYFFRLKKRRTKQGDGASTVSTNHKMTLSKSERDMGCFIIWKCK